MIPLQNSTKIFTSFFIFGLLNNILYVIILSAAIDLVGSATPKGVVLLADIMPSFTFKLVAPFFIHLIPYKTRLFSLVGLSSTGMLLISLSSQQAIVVKIFGIMLASLSSGMGEVSFLQLTHFYTGGNADGDSSIGISGFSSGTGGAGLCGSFLFMLMTNMLGIPVTIVLLLFAICPLGFLATYYLLLPLPDHEYHEIEDTLFDESSEEIGIDTGPVDLESSTIALITQHFKTTLGKIQPLIVPFMIPLSMVYISEYVINQGIAPTLLYPLEDLPRWLFTSYRDIYVVYGFLYQLGVFISRSSISFGIRIKRLYLLSVLQFVNVIITIIQSVYDFPFTSIWLLLILILYEGLLGGFSYVNTFVSVSEGVPKTKREFSMGCVSVSDGLGIAIAGCINLWLEKKLCGLQVDRGRDWCLNGGSV
ncbi:Yhc3 protein [Candida orthopsilosis Co 90-125]|uniref:Protein BTN n=1 Tax=Candida orthopsilosis (strain 90-125) TaxID=1136231 RepID=H8X0A7_CANO9|nr:Yhc3 protein [Candida orthopsilosis Co 90-125]CCG22619.1 Yhc3 protein [Candida orthopsilosis Co 90-125]